MQEILITKENEGQRADKFVRKFLNDAPLSFIYRIFRKKDVKINGHWITIDYILKKDDVMRIYVTDEQLKEFNNPRPIESIKFNHEIIYEDDNILIVNKPRGLLVHGDEKEKRMTLSNQVLSYLYAKGEYNPKTSQGFTPAPAHRIDRNTSGLVVFGKTIKALQCLLELFKDKETLEKEYLALVVGKVNKGGTIYDIEEKFENYTLLKIRILTGRTHQIRAHMLYIHHPVVGDGKYGDFATNRYFKDTFNFENQFLHAHKIEFKNVPGELNYLSNKCFVANLPKEEKDILSKLA